MWATVPEAWHCAWRWRSTLREAGAVQLARRYCADLPLEINMSWGKWWKDLLIISEALAGNSGI